MADKKAQLRIQEMSFMLVAVFIFFALVGLFVINIIGLDLRGEARNIGEAQALSSVVRLASSPEFVCVGGKSNCVDVDKVIGLMKSASYRNFWDFSSLRVIRESGFDKSEEEMVDCLTDLSNLDNCNRFEVYDKNVGGEIRVGSFVALCWTEYKDYIPYERCEVGKLVIGREVEEVSSLFVNPIQYLMQMVGEDVKNYLVSEKTPLEKFGPLWLLGLIILLLIILIVYLINKKGRKER